MPNFSFEEQAIKLWEFLTSPAGKLLLDSIEGYAGIALTVVNPPLGATWSVVSTLAEMHMDFATGNNLDFLQKFIEQGVSKRFGIVGDVAIIKAKQFWHLTDIIGAQKFFSNFIKEHIFQSSYFNFNQLNDKTRSFSTYFNQAVLPDLKTYFKEAAKKYIAEIYNTRLTTNTALLTSIQMKDAINAMLSEGTILSLNLNLGIRYQELLTPDVLQHFDKFIDNTVKVGVDRFKAIVSDNAINYIDYGNGQYYVGKINQLGSPHGEGALITRSGKESAIWKDGVQLKDNPMKGGYSMLIETAALVSIISGLYGIKSNIAQTELLEGIHDLMSEITKHLQQLPDHLNNLFDDNATKNVLALANSGTNLLCGLKEFKNRNTIESAFLTARFNVNAALHRLTDFSPLGNDKLAFATGIAVCANNLLAVTLAEFIFLPNERREVTLNIVEDIIKRINSYNSGAVAAIDQRFSLAPVGRMAIHGAGGVIYYCTYLLDGQNNVDAIGMTILNGSLEKCKNDALIRMQTHKDKLYHQAQPTLENLDKIRWKCRDFLVGLSFVEIFGRAPTPEEIRTWNIRLIKINFDQLRLEMSRTDEGKKKIEDAFQEILGHKNLGNNGAADIDHWTQKLSKVGYENVRLEIASSAEAKANIIKFFKDKFGHAPTEMEYWIAKLAKEGLKALLSAIQNSNSVAPLPCDFSSQDSGVGCEQPSPTSRKLFTIEEEDTEGNEPITVSSSTSSATRTSSVLGSTLNWSWGIVGAAYSIGKGFMNTGYQYVSNYFLASRESAQIQASTSTSSQQKVKSSSAAARDVKLDTRHMMDVVDGIPSLQAVGENYQIRVFPKSSAHATSALSMRTASESVNHTPLSGDQYNSASCRPVEFHGRPSVYCEGEKTSVVYTPTLPTPPLQNLDSNISLAAIGVYWASQGINGIRALVNTTSCWWYGNKRSTPEVLQQTFSERIQCAENLQIVRELKELNETFDVLKQQFEALQKISNRLSFYDQRWLRDEVTETFEEWQLTIEQLSATDNTVLEQIKELQQDFVVMKNALFETKPVDKVQATAFWAADTKSVEPVAVVTSVCGSVVMLDYQGPGISKPHSVLLLRK